MNKMGMNHRKGKGLNAGVRKGEAERERDERQIRVKRNKQNGRK